MTVLSVVVVGRGVTCFYKGYVRGYRGEIGDVRGMSLISGLR